MKVNFNKIEQVSTVDYPGKSACVVFFNGCPWGCPYCHNKQTWTEVNMVDVDYVKAEIKKCLPFISAVVFSGGEPTMQIDPLVELCKYSKSLGLFVGIETNGYNPGGLLNAKPYIDKIFLDLKSPLNDVIRHYRATKNNDAIDGIDNINIVLQLDIIIEIRIVDINKFNTKDIIKSIGNKHKITVLPYVKRD